MKTNLVYLVVAGSLLGSLLLLLRRPVSPTVMGKWRWQYGWHKHVGLVRADSTRAEVFRIFHTDSTYSSIEGGDTLIRRLPFSVTRGPNPGKAGEFVNFLTAPDSSGYSEPYTTIWLKGEDADTLVYMTMSPSRNFEPYIYSVFSRVKD